MPTTSGLARHEANHHISQRVDAMALAAALAAPSHSALLLSRPWPESYQPIRRLSFSTVDEVVELMRPQSEAGVPLIIEGSEMIEVEKWRPLSYAGSLLQDRKAGEKGSMAIHR